MKKILMILIIALAFFACDNDNGSETHTHDYGTEWKSNATQHWHECSCGEKADIANHSGDPCDICGYASGSQNPDICECNGKAENCDCEDCDCEVCEEEIPDVSEPVIASYSATPATITVPAENSVQLNCTATSADGSAVKSIQWTVEQKPALANPTIANAQTDTAAVNNMNVAGTYKFKLVVTGNNDVPKTEYVTVIAGLNVNVSFVSLAASFPNATIDFSPSASLPAGVTYIVTDNSVPQKSWNSAEGFGGQITAASYYNGISDTNVTFTQTFYLNGVEITGVSSKRTVVTTVHTTASTRFLSANSNTASVTLKWPVGPLAAHAQAEPTHTLANDLTITLDGTDSTGNISAYAWECVSYTANQGAVSAVYSKAQVDALIANANTATATVAPCKAGTYVFKLTVTGDEGESDTDTVAVVVGAMTHTITVPAITTVANPLDFGAVSALTGWNSDFASTDVTYTLTLDNVDQPANTTSISASGLSDGQHTITQTFYYKGNPVPNGSRSGIAGVMGYSFLALLPANTGNIPELPLLLSKGEL